MTQDEDLRLARAVSTNAIALRMSAVAPLSSVELQFLFDMSRQTRKHAPREELSTEGRVSQPRILLSGWACRQRLLGDGRRQIISFLLPGDPCSPLERPQVPQHSAVVALSSVAVVDARALDVAIHAGSTPYPGLALAARLLAIQDGLLLQDQVVRLGRQTAYERMVHLLLELRGRLAVVRLLDDNVFPMPLTQEILADALGLSIVHVNRTLQQIRRDGMLEFRGGHVTILDLPMMQAVADWTPLPLGETQLRAGVG
jgi:CRP-like cAMP-binding protein